MQAIKMDCNNAVVEGKKTWQDVALRVREVKRVMEEWSRKNRIGVAKGTLMPVNPYGDQQSWKKTPRAVLLQGFDTGDSGREAVAPWKWTKSTFDSTEIASTDEIAMARHDELTANFKQVVAYTDESKIAQGTGSGAIIMTSQDSIELMGSAERPMGIFDAEMEALLTVLRKLNLMILSQGTTIRIFTDSQACMKSLMQVNRWETRHSVRKLVIEAYKVMNGQIDSLFKRQE
jgi:ribonuclease HI